MTLTSGRFLDVHPQGDLLERKSLRRAEGEDVLIVGGELSDALSECDAESLDRQAKTC